MQLPPVDPAGSPRVTARQDNPYIPKGMRQPRTAAVYSAPPLATPHEDAAPSGAKMRIPVPPPGSLSARSHRGRPDRSPGRASHASGSHSARSLGASPRSTLSDATAILIAKRKRLERLHDSYHTAHSRELLMSEGYDKELAQVRERLQQLSMAAPPGRVKTELAQAVRQRAKLERRVGGFEEKLNELEAYNEKLVAMISGLRKQNEPHRQATKRAQAALEKLSADMIVQKANCHKALDERERCKDLLRRTHEESIRDTDEIDEHIEALRQQADELDRKNRRLERTLDDGAEAAKRAQSRSMRYAREQRERMEVRYGYLRSQLEGIENEFRELQRIVGVRFEPSHPESLQLIIDTFVQKDERVTSLQKYAALQNDDIEALGRELAQLHTQEAAAAELAAGAPSAHSERVRGGVEEGELDKLEAHFHAVCTTLESMFGLAGCAEDVAGGGAALATKGCSTSTVVDFFASVAAKLDEASAAASTLREVMQSSRATASRKPNDALEAFLRQRTLMAPVGSESSADGASGGAHSAQMVRRPPKEELPSISDMGVEAEGEGDASEGRKRTELKKGAIDKEKRDAAIANWAKKQQASRESKYGHDFREAPEEPSLPRRAIYPPASAR